MKKVILAIAVVAFTAFTSCNETKKENEKEKTTATEEKAEPASIEGLAIATFGVRGNCGMCKATIEKAANGVNGVAKASWDVDHKIIKVAYDDSKTDEVSIKKAVAASGYDTEGINGSEEAYKNLPACCQYDHTMDMNQ